MATSNNKQPNSQKNYRIYNSILKKGSILAQLSVLINFTELSRFEHNTL